MGRYRLYFPKCSQAEMNCFLYNCTPDGQEKRFYDGSQITRPEDALGLARKRAATTARQANLPHNLAKKHQYLTQQGLDPQFTIDFDEAGIFIETTDRGYAKVANGNYAREEGPYGHSAKYTIAMAICGIAQGSRCVNVEVNAGTVADTVSFVSQVIADLPPGGGQYTFLCDNLSSHKHPLVAGTIYHSGHRLLFRPPYCPWLGPIEYVFNPNMS